MRAAVDATKSRTIAVDTGQDDITKTPTAYCFSSVFRLVRVQRWGCPRSLYRAEPAPPSACIAHQLPRINFVQWLARLMIPTMIVAVAALRPSASVVPSFPPQQSPILGHRASSHTVLRLRPRKSFLILLNEAPEGMLVLRKEGSRGLKDRV